MFLAAAAILALAFIANVVFGAFTGIALLSDVTEMLVLFAASVLFVIEILRREAAEQEKSGRDQ
ncbi:hypothetical protein LV82_01685 [Albidovulum inexpectatum]|uniref:Uncharacterized protein n=1 Tax=Albidovulum inexpectatum TaxID=196587 RepID=A0A2S5JHM7_9RHOB|nr:hypothetical protein [Albidovulum inexpectatum]PPB80952.1 hypothetical protein LV82_01685 [Albidovulum inexpectatum]